MKPSPITGGVAFIARGTEPHSYRITVTRESRSILVAFHGAGDYGLSIAREFFESPFFKREETERFYGMLSKATPRQLATFERFAVRFEFIDSDDGFHLTMRFDSHAQ